MASSHFISSTSKKDIISVDATKVRKVIPLSKNFLLLGMRIDQSIYLGYEIWEKDVNPPYAWCVQKKISRASLFPVIKMHDKTSEEKISSSNKILPYLEFKEPINNGELVFSTYYNEELFLYLFNPYNKQEFILKIQGEYVSALNGRDILTIQPNTGRSALFIYDFTTGHCHHSGQLTGSGNHQLIQGRTSFANDPKLCRLNTVNYLVLWHDIIVNKKDLLKKEIKLDETTDSFDNSQAYSMLDDCDAITFGGNGDTTGFFVSSNPRLVKGKDESYECPLSDKNMCVSRIFPLINRHAAFANTHHIEILDCSQIPRLVTQFEYNSSANSASAMFLQSVQLLIDNTLLLQNRDRVDIWDLNNALPHKIDTIPLPSLHSSHISHALFRDGRIGIIDSSNIKIITPPHVACIDEIKKTTSVELARHRFPSELDKLVQSYMFFTPQKSSQPTNDTNDLETKRSLSPSFRKHTLSS